MTSVTSGVGCPRLSIIIPTRNRPDYLRAVVNQLLNEQDFTDFELIIIDQTSDTPPVQYSDPRVHYHRVPLIGPLAGMNEGVARACGAVILFLNDDVYIPNRDFLEAHLACYLNPEVGGVGGRIIDRVTKPNTRRIQCKVTWTGRTVENLTGHKCCKLQSVPGTNMSFRANVFWQLGLFDTGYTGNALLGETDFATRVRAAGWTLMFAPKAELVHLAASSGGVRSDKLAREYSRFRNTGYYVAKHRGFVGLPPFGLTFSAIAAKRAWEWREIGALPKLWRAMGEGVLAGQKQHRGRLGRNVADVRNWLTSAARGLPIIPGKIIALRRCGAAISRGPNGRDGRRREAEASPEPIPVQQPVQPKPPIPMPMEGGGL